jgi:hypothetical protein
MFPKYQNDVLDKDNKAKKRVIRYLSKSYKNIPSSVAGNGVEVEYLYEILDKNLTKFITLASESGTYFVTLRDEDENETITGVKLPFNAVASRMLSNAKEIRKISKKIAPIFNSLNNEQVNNLADLVRQSADSTMYLEELVSDGMLEILVAEIVNVVDEFSDQLIKLCDSYTPVALITPMV